ncbi:MAG: hypothetical protein R3F13_21685 [Prosthecobacter sp.]
MSRRTRTAIRRKSSPLRWLAILAVILIVGCALLALLAPTLVTRFIRAYVQKEEFRMKAEELIAAKTGGDAHIESLSWHDDHANVSELRLEDAHGVDLEAVNLHAGIDFGAIRKGLWSVHSAGADEITLSWKPSDSLKSIHTSDFGSTAEESDGVPTFLRRYLPTRTELGGFDVERFSFEMGPWKITNASFGAEAWESGQSSVPVQLSGGMLQSPFKAPQQTEPLKLNIDKATLRLGADHLQLSTSSLRWKQSSEARVRGAVEFASGSWEVFTRLENVPLDEFLDPWWKQRLSGRISGDIESSGSKSSAVAWKANAVLTKGVLEGLPILATLADYTRTPRFKRLVLDTCQATIRPDGGALRFEKIIVHSNGLIRIEGTMSLRGNIVDGDFMVGVTPETLRFIPGAEQLVFTEQNLQGPPGLLWTRVRVAGTLDAPREDLSARLLGGAGMSLLFDTPEKIVKQGADTLLKPVLGDEASKMPGKVIEGATGLLENGVKTGAGLLNGVLPK